ncbi:MAG: hypothetical protein IPH30_11630 [Betaproteobacteria bacterium]|nr:hypothetical protein [Betaproteobacteria bacterium]
MNIEDPIPFARIGVTAAWTPDKDLLCSERAHAEFTYRYLGWRADLSWNRSDFTTSSAPPSAAGRGLAVKAVTTTSSSTTSRGASANSSTTLAF